MSNHLLLGLQFYLTDVFLYRKFSSYGWDTLQYFSHPLRCVQINVRHKIASLFDWYAETGWVWPEVWGTRCAPSSPLRSAATSPRWAPGATSRTTTASASWPRWGVKRSSELNDYLQNIINEKIYLLLWFWYMFVAVWSTLSMFVTISVLSFDSIRFGLIYKVVS